MSGDMNALLRQAAGKAPADGAQPGQDQGDGGDDPTARLRSRIGQLEAENRALRLKHEVGAVNRAQRLGIIDEDAAITLLSPDAAQYDDMGRPVGVVDALRRLLRAKPYLAKK